MQVKVLSASGDATNTRAMLRGFSIAAGGSAVVVNLREESSSGTIIAQVKVAANDSKIESVDIPFTDKIYVEFNSGTPSHCAIYFE